MAAHATVVGSGPNGLAAAVTLARAGYHVRVLEAASSPGGSARTGPLTLPGFVHDIGSAVHPLALSSPFLRAFGIDSRVEWLIPEASFAHPLPHGEAAIAWRDLDRTAEGLGADGAAWRRLAGGLRDRRDDLVETILNTLVRVPPHPAALAWFGAQALRQASTVPRATFRTTTAQALWTGVAAHAGTHLPSLAASATGLLLLAHAHSPTGWPLPRGGAGAIMQALADDLHAHGGLIETDCAVRDLASLDWGDPAQGDLLIHAGAPRALLDLPALPASYRRALRALRYGPAAAKLDLALSGPVPWTHPDVAQAPTVHLGGDATQIAAAESAVMAGRAPERPYVLVAQPSVIDPTRAPAGQHTLWAYTHVPGGSGIDPTEAIVAQLEEHAPGIRDLIQAAHVTTARDFAALNPAAILGDGLGGRRSMRQLLRRPVLSPTPWRTPAAGVYLASSAAVPGPGVHGMAGWLAARTALGDAWGQPPELADLFATLDG